MALPSPPKPTTVSWRPFMADSSSGSESGSARAEWGRFLPAEVRVLDVDGEVDVDADFPVFGLEREMEKGFDGASEEEPGDGSAEGMMMLGKVFHIAD